MYIYIYEYIYIYMYINIYTYIWVYTDENNALRLALSSAEEKYQCQIKELESSLTRKGMHIKTYYQ
jgi:hypothetical protein